MSSRKRGPRREASALRAAGLSFADTQKREAKGGGF